MKTKANTTAPTLNLFGTSVKLNNSTVRLRDFNTRSNYSSIADFKDKNGTPKERSWNYITDPKGKNRADENLHDIFLKSSEDGKKVELYNRNNFNVGERLTINAQADGTISDNDKTTIENTIRAWETEALRFSDRKFVAANSAIKGDLSPVASAPADKPASASGDATINRFSAPLSTFASTFLGAKSPKVATTFMGQTLFSGSTEPTEVVTFPDNPAYNIRVTYDSETGRYTVKAPIKGITKGSTFKNAKDAERAIAKYKTAIEKHLAKTKKPEKNATPTYPFSLQIEGLDTSRFKVPDYSDKLRSEALWS